MTAAAAAAAATFEANDVAVDVIDDSGGDLLSLSE